MKLTGQMIHDAYVASTDGEVAWPREWEELTVKGRQTTEAVAQIVSERLHLEEIEQLLIDYKAHLERICMTDGHEGARLIADQLREEGATLGLWPSRESEETKPVASYLLCFGRHASCSTIDSLKELIEQYVRLEQVFSVHIEHTYQHLGIGVYERTEQGICVLSEEGEAVGLYKQLGFEISTAEIIEQALERRGRCKFEIDLTLPDVAVGYYEELCHLIATTELRSIGENLADEIKEMDEQAARLGLEFQVENGKVTLVPKEATDAR